MDPALRLPKMPNQWILPLNPRTHEIISENLGKSALYGGRISGVGPRYCPSLEDKVVRFAARERHQVFLEPEGPDSPLVRVTGFALMAGVTVQRRPMPGQRRRKRRMLGH